MALKISVNKYNILFDKSVPAGTVIASLSATGGTAPYTFSLDGEELSCYALNGTDGSLVTVTKDMLLDDMWLVRAVVTDSTGATDTSDWFGPDISAPQQDYFDKTNTIFKITQDLDLKRGALLLLEGCTLDFQGGSIKNGKIFGNNTGIKAGLRKIFEPSNLEISGTWNITESYPEWFGAVGDGVKDCTVAIQKTIDSFRGKIQLCPHTYLVSSTIKLKSERILNGVGSGAYFQGGGYERLTVILPSKEFNGNSVISIDPQNSSDTAAYCYGISVNKLLIDCTNVVNKDYTILKIRSLSNSDEFTDIKIINNNNNTALDVGISDNAGAFESDGLTFSNLYFINKDSTAETSVTTLVKIGPCNEIAFRDCKFQKGSIVDPSTAVLVTGTINKAAQGITFDGCSFTSAGTGIKFQGNIGDANGPRVNRVINCTWEYTKYAIWAVGALETGSSIPSAVQFCNFGPGNRINTRRTGGVDILLDAYATNNMVYATDDISIKCAFDSQENFIIGGTSDSEIGGTNNVRVYSRLGKFIVNSLIVNEITTLNPENTWVNLTPRSGWTNVGSSKNLLSYKKDLNGLVHLRGYLTGGEWGYRKNIGTLPTPFRPQKSYEIVTCSIDSGETKIARVVIGTDGTFFAYGSGTTLSLDGIYFDTN